MFLRDTSFTFVVKVDERFVFNKLELKMSVFIDIVENNPGRLAAGNNFILLRVLFI